MSSRLPDQMYLAGQWVKREREIEVLDPQDNRLLQKVPAASETDMFEAIKQAKAGKQIAADLPTFERMAILHRAADCIADQHERYADVIAQEGSKTIREARKEVTRCIQTLRISAEEARRISGETIAFDQMEGSQNRMGYYYRFPIGIVGAITPFNDPLNLVAHKVGPAIAAGNAIIVKPANTTPLSALLLAEAFDQAGLPKKILSVITGYGREIGDVLVTHPDVRMISFTGGLTTGQAILQKAGLKKVNMELGSNSPVIVLRDAKMTEAVSAIASGAFWAAGQNCLGVQRVYVETAIFDDFCKAFTTQAKKVKIGDKRDEQTDMGPLITESEAKRVERQIADSVKQGAKILCGGKRRGAYYLPTVLLDVPSHTPIAKEEIFAPVVMLTPVPDLGTAIRLANDVNYGLQAGIFTQDLQQALQAIKQLDVGGVMVNDSSDYRIDAMPFGGVKGSGLGREGVKFTIQEMTEPKVVCFQFSK